MVTHPKDPELQALPESGASRTRTGDLLGAMHRQAETVGTAGSRIARIYRGFGFSAARQ